jgi:UDP-N-acetylglucosamine--N-acetylmuramyl-(pentapeptide) pyrophosphoryl-undecaprenol N-acetylglucosamine transferase
VRLVVTGGGTGGHIYPAIAVAEYLIEDDPCTEVVFVGSEAGPEKGAAASAGIEFTGLVVYGVVGKSPMGALKAGLAFLKAAHSCRAMFKRMRPDCVLGTGGYAAAPACFAAVTSRIPLVLHEMNFEPGLVTRLFCRWARAVALAYEGTSGKMPSGARCEVTGVPVRQEIAALADPGARKEARLEGLERFGLDDGRATLMVFGGSQGAEALNDAMLRKLPLLSDRKDLQVLHLTGQKNYDSAERLDVEAALAGKALIYRAVPYSDRMDLAYAVSDVAVSRAGAGTVAELTAVALPAVLVPFPYAGAHQEMNARALASTGGVVVVLQEGGSASGAIDRAVDLVDDEVSLDEMRKAAAGAALADGAKGIALLLEEVT